MANSQVTDEEAIDNILKSDNLRKVLKSLVKEEIQAKRSQGNTLQKLSDLLHQVNSTNNVSSELTKQSSGPIIPINDLRGEDGIGYTQEERRLRCELASIYRLMDTHGWTLNVYNHITIRSSGDSEEFLINPMGLLYREITASSLVKINIEGHTLDAGSSVFGINKAGWSLHAALHSARSDITCVIHTHVPDVIAVSCLKYGLLCLTPESRDLLDSSPSSLSRGVTYHDYWGLAVNPEEWPSIKADIGPHSKILFLRNHGVAVCGRDCGEAWILLKRLVKACENQIRMLQTRGEKSLLDLAMSPTIPSSDGEGSEAAVDELRRHREESAQLEFEAYMRTLDKAGYHTGHMYVHGNLLRKGCGLVFSGCNDQLHQVQNSNLRGDEVLENGHGLDSTMANVTDISMDRTAVSSNANGTAHLDDNTKNLNQSISSKQKAAQRNQWLIKTMSPEQSTTSSGNYGDHISMATTASSISDASFYYYKGNNRHNDGEHMHRVRNCDSSISDHSDGAPTDTASMSTTLALMDDNTSISTIQSNPDEGDTLAMAYSPVNSQYYSVSDLQINHSNRDTSTYTSPNSISLDSLVNIQQKD